MSLLRRLKALFSRSDLSNEINEELASHVEMRTTDNIAAGMSPEAARRDALLRFGNPTVTKEKVTAVDMALTLDTLFWDLRHAVRRLLKSPWFTLTAVVTLALGIGANTAIFSIVEAVLLRPLPYQHSDKLVVIWQADSAHRSTGAWFNAYREFEAWQRNSHSFEQLTPLTWATVGKTLLWHNKPVDLLPIPAGVNFFSMLGVSAQMGRTFLERDLTNNCTLVLSHRFWEQKLNAPTDIVGQNLTLSSGPCQVVGVMSKDFSFYPLQTDAWTLITSRSDFVQKPWETMTGVFGLLKPGVSRAEAEAELTAVQTRVAREAPADVSMLRTMTPDVLDLQSNFTWLAGRNLKTALWVLLDAVALILLMACINLATLLLGRAAERSREMAMRAALGSGRGRLFRQMFIEVLLLALAGTCAGVVLALLLLSWFRATNPIELPPGNTIALDWRVLLFSMILGVGSAVVFGVFPAWRGSQIDLNTMLKSGERDQGASASMQRASQWFVVLQVALSLTLLSGASLLGESLWKLSSTHLGYRTDHLLTAKINLPQQRYADVSARSRFADSITERIATLPGVQGVTLGSDVVPRGMSPISVASRASPDGTSEGVATQDVAANFFSLMRVSLLRGRAFDSRDRKEAQNSAIVNEALAKKYFKNSDPIGQAIKLSRPDDDKVPWLTIVGVVSDVKTSTVFQEMGYVEQPSVYRPLTQDVPASLSLIVATERSPIGLTSELQRQLSETDHDLVLTGVQTIEQMQSTVLSQPRFRAVLFSSFALLALILAVVGLYGVLLQAVLQRTREIGIRMAVGADRSRILWSVLRRALAMVGTGMLLGMAGAVAAGNLIRGLLYDVRALDPMLLGSALLVMLLVGMVAALQPALRASSINPVQALRSE